MATKDREQLIDSLQESIKQLTLALLQAESEHSRIYRHILDIIEVPMIEKTLDFSNGNQSMAAKLLGLNRTTLRDRLRRHNLI